MMTILICIPILGINVLAIALSISVLVVVIIAGVIFFVCRRKKAKEQERKNRKDFVVCYFHHYLTIIRRRRGDNRLIKTETKSRFLFTIITEPEVNNYFSMIS
jgi:hypothetical protein